MSKHTQSTANLKLADSTRPSTVKNLKSAASEENIKEVQEGEGKKSVVDKGKKVNQVMEEKKKTPAPKKEIKKAADNKSED